MFTVDAARAAYELGSIDAECGMCGQVHAFEHVPYLAEPVASCMHQLVMTVAPRVCWACPSISALCCVVADLDRHFDYLCCHAMECDDMTMLSLVQATDYDAYALITYLNGFLAWLFDMSQQEMPPGQNVLSESYSFCSPYWTGIYAADFSWTLMLPPDIAADALLNEVFTMLRRKLSPSACASLRQLAGTFYASSNLIVTSTTSDISRQGVLLLHAYRFAAGLIKFVRIVQQVDRDIEAIYIKA